MAISGQMQYFVYMTPRMTADDNSYGDEIDVSDRVIINGIGAVTQSVDAGDYDVGVFTFNELNLKGQNFNGYFNDENDTRSIFRAGRDRAKVRVVFQKLVLTKDSRGTVYLEETEETVTFRGIINDEATRLEVVDETVTFKVLSRDSVLRTTKISGGVVGNTMLTTDAIFAMLNVPRITAVLTVLEANINPPLNIRVDIGAKFDNKTVKDGLDQLLNAVNAVLTIDADGTVFVTNREESMNDVLALYGKNDEEGRENIIDISNYNNGRQRMFNAVRVNDQEIANNVFVAAFGFRKKALTLDWITDGDKALEIAARLLDEFKFPKIELNVKVPTEVSKNTRLLDPVSINYPLRVEPIEGKFLPVIGAAKIGDPLTPLPYSFGAVTIFPRVSFKVIEISDNPSDFTTTLKLRQTGRGYDDGYFDNPASCRIGFAVIGIAKICGTGDDCDTFNPSVVAAAEIGCTLVG